MNTQFINHTISRVTSNQLITNFLVGSGLCYSIQNEKYWHIPFVLFFPTAYTGY